MSCSYLTCNFIGKFNFNSNHYYTESVTLYTIWKWYKGQLTGDPRNMGHKKALYVKSIMYLVDESSLVIKCKSLTNRSQRYGQRLICQAHRHGGFQTMYTTLVQTWYSRIQSDIWKNTILLIFFLSFYKKPPHVHFYMLFDCTQYITLK